MANRSRALTWVTGAVLAATIFAVASPAYAWSHRSRIAFSRSFVRPHARFHVFARPFVPHARFIHHSRFLRPHRFARIFARPFPHFAARRGFFPRTTAVYGARGGFPY